MQSSHEKLPKSIIEIKFEIPLEKFRPFLEQASAEISQQKQIPGYRPGKAPFDIVKQHVGEMEIYQKAANYAILKTYQNYIKEKDLQVVEQPEINVEKLAPGNAFIYKAKVAVLPEVELGDYNEIKVEKPKEIKIKEKEISDVLEDLRKRQAKETLEDKASEKGDKVLVDFDVKKDNVSVEHGQEKDYPLVLGEGRMIPGFEDNLIGLKKDEAKTFKVTFPKEYPVKNLAGQLCTVDAKVKSVYKIAPPELNDEFAKSLGVKDLADLKAQIEKNLKHEKEHKEEDKFDLRILEKLIDISKYEELPDVLVNGEVDKMLNELKYNVINQGMQFEDYLKDVLKKTVGQLKLDFTADAIKRLKTALAMEKIAEKEKIEISDEEVNSAVEKNLEAMRSNPSFEQIRKQLESDQYKHNLKHQMKNRKVIELLRSKVK